MRSSLILLFTGTKRASHRLKTLLFSECPTMEHLLKKSPFPLNKLKKKTSISVVGRGRCFGFGSAYWLSGLVYERTGEKRRNRLYSRCRKRCCDIFSCFC